MLRLTTRAVELLVFMLLLVPAGFSKNATLNADNDPKNPDETLTSAAPDNPAAANPDKAGATVSSADPADSNAPAQDAGQGNKDKPAKKDT